MLRHRLESYLGANLWLIPLLCVLGGIALALGTTAIDRYFDHGLIPQSLTGNPNAAQTILNMIATSMVMLISVAPTLTLVRVQMGRFSPRIVRALLRAPLGAWQLLLWRRPRRRHVLRGLLPHPLTTP